MRQFTDEAPDPEVSWRRYFTDRVRQTVQDLTHRPDGDFCADLAGWLIDEGHVESPSARADRLRDAAYVVVQRDRAWARLERLERENYGLRKQLEKAAGIAVAPPGTIPNGGAVP